MKLQQNSFKTVLKFFVSAKTKRPGYEMF